MVFQKVGIRDVVVYEISTISLDDDVLQRLGLRMHCYKDAVIALILMLHANLSRESFVRGIIDADTDQILDTHIPCKYLLVTDYTCTEMYLCGEPQLFKFLKLVMHTGLKIENVLSEILPALQYAFCLRAAGKVFGLKLSFVDCANHCSFKQGKVIFQKDAYLCAILQKSNQWETKSKVEKQIESLLARCKPDYRHYVHGHDFLSLFAWFMSKRNAPAMFRDAEGLGRAVLGCVELEDIKNESLFSTLIKLFK